MGPMMILTTCSANHLAQAKSLGDSLQRYNAGYKLVIGLVDKLNGRLDKSEFAPHDLVEAHEMGLKEFPDMCKRYSVYELNCALKSFFMWHVLKTYQPSKLIFLDSDMLAFHSFTHLESMLDQHSILLTPHIMSPFPDDHKPAERDILKAGVYNAGFLGLRNDSTTTDFLAWWKDRMVDQCYEKPKLGLTVDQNWLNLVPIYFSNVHIVRHPGFNVAYWNLHERKLSKKNEQYFVNEDSPLLFFHYSGYKIEHPDKVSKHQDRFDFKYSDVVKDLFGIYHEALIRNGHDKMKNLEFFYKQKKSFLQKAGLKK